jgi:putative endonuclease
MAFLMMKGYRILAWRYKTPVGEIDIIAKRGNVLAFVEVKLRPELDDGLYAVTPKMQQRITRAAEHFMAGNRKFHKISQRFDVVAVAGWRVRHLDNAW